MDEDQIFEQVLEQLKACKDELRGNKLYCVCDRAGSKVDKRRLKSRFIQGDGELPHTKVMITVSDRVALKIENSPIYIYGEYIKLSRNMTQSPLRISGRLKCERSVSDFCTQARSFFRAKHVVFIPAGREDYDVMMLGGRPFLLEVKDPKINLEFDRMSLVLHEGIEIVNFNLVTRECKKAVFEGENESGKIYRAFICSGKQIGLERCYDIRQQTPLRVLHRRANVTRDKKVEILNTVEKRAGEWFYYSIMLRASAGTYIKEFVNGDLGRTAPSLATPENYCDLLELDVVEVEKKDVKKYIVRKIDLETLRCPS
jgi:tRNA pseudouridine synthase 10